MGVKLTRWIVALAISGLMMALILAGAAKAQDAAGEWHGTLSNATTELHIGVEIAAKPGGGYRGRLISPDQSSDWLPLDSVTLENGHLVLSGARLNGRYEGWWDDVQSAFVGEWTHGETLSLVLTRGKVEPRARPQTPKPPFPYRAEEVGFNSAPGVRLAGTLTLPKGRGPFPAAVLITGSGAQDRDESIMGHKPFAVLADALTRRGIAVLRTDDRGFAKSTGDFARATSEDFAADTEAAVAYLRGRPEIDDKRIGLIGHSEGGMIAPMVAVADPQVAFVVMLAGPGVPSRELMTAQRGAVAKSLGAPPETVARNEAIMGRVEAALAQAKDWDQAQADAAKVLTDAGVPAAGAATTVKQLGSAWYKWFIAYDPRPTLRKVRAPVLAIAGDKDVQVVSAQNLPAIREALKDNPDAEVVELPGLNHLFQTAATGAPSEYPRIEETMSPAALDLVTGWVVKHTRR
ncbi:alpha/beta hydrolase family protein [Phenylobacterium sp.]|uniref:alpha/beta hydrolase family protein n=1 Tax=Phenylobacterium sp. TaxID=1871053 RepID=UPI002E322ABB|nr:alpha/beta fold hydrolase [Phenylobacterium sp.]HEX4711791.1 alpha/beta fold hydrolase [Phenylobacterium sp.]